MPRFVRHFSVFVLFIALVSLPSCTPQDLPTGSVRGGIVSTAQHVASDVGRDILQQGGNAVDAAIATAFALAVVHPAAGNIGGGGFLVYHGADGKVTTFNFREKAPAAAGPAMFLTDGEIDEVKHHRALTSTGVPGTVAGLALAHKRLGSLPWADLLEPAIRLAEEGFPFTENLMDFQERILDSASSNPIYASTVRAFLKKGTEAHATVELLIQKDLAESLKRIRNNGADGFYKGETARLMAEFMAANGGLITEQDMADYQAEELPAIHGTYRGYDIYSMPPPSSGGIAIVTMLNILEEYDMGAIEHNSAPYLHLLTEAMRRGFADRAQFIGDPNFNPDMPVDWLTSKKHAVDLASSINPDAASPSDSSTFNGFMPYESEETTHFSVADEAGNTVSMTYTLENSYGNSIVVEGAGFLLNNEMGDFNPKPGHTDRSGNIGTLPNLTAPGKRMLSSMTPVIVGQNGRPVMAIGSPGGRTIINTSLQVVLNVLDHGMSIGDAIEAGRIHHQWLPDRTSYESTRFTAETMSAYEHLGHTISSRNGQGSAMGIWIDWKAGVKYGASDSRSSEGSASGY